MEELKNMISEMLLYCDGKHVFLGNKLEIIHAEGPFLFQVRILKFSQ
jgi:hypothetical protein